MKVRVRVCCRYFLLCISRLRCRCSRRRRFFVVSLLVSFVFVLWLMVIGWSQPLTLPITLNHSLLELVIEMLAKHAVLTLREATLLETRRGRVGV